VAPFKSEEGKIFEDWPAIGEILIDKRGDRRLTVTEIRPKDHCGRNVVGTLDDGRTYSCNGPKLVHFWERLDR
jgi:hypothetical protein